jgi:hypothetical protein
MQMKDIEPFKLVGDTAVVEDIVHFAGMCLAYNGNDPDAAMTWARERFALNRNDARALRRALGKVSRQISSVGVVDFGQLRYPPDDPNVTADMRKNEGKWVLRCGCATWWPSTSAARLAVP